MQNLICPGCGGSLSVTDGSNIAFCPYCGTRVILEQNVKTGGGLTDINGPEGAYFSCRLPQGWSGRGFSDSSTFSLACPVRAGMVLSGPDGEIIFRSAAVWRDIDSTGFMRPRENELAPDSSVRFRSFLTAQSYCDALLMELHPSARDVRLLRELPVTPERKRAVEQFTACTQKKLDTQLPGTRFSAELAGRVYAFEEGQRRMRCAVTALIDRVDRPASGFFGQLIKQPCDWECYYEFVLSSPERSFESNLAVYNGIDGTVQEGQALTQLRAQAAQTIRDTQNYTANVQMQMANQRMNANARMAQIQRDKADYINGVQQSMHQNASSTAQRVADMQSEAVRGVNSFYGANGPVEASTGWEHVYQSSSEPDRYAASKGATVDSPDFDELKKRY